jgi:hypothetical protein
MVITSMMTVSWASIAACVFAGAAMTVLACILLAELTQRHRARQSGAHRSTVQAHEQISPDETGREHLHHAGHEHLRHAA